MLALALVVAAVGPAAAQTDDRTTTTRAVDGGDDVLPECEPEVAGLSLATTLDFANVPRALAEEGSTGDPSGEIASYELYCPYGALSPSAPSDADAPLELLLAWVVAPGASTVGCRAGDADVDATSGSVGDPDRQAQVDWSVADDQVETVEAVVAAELLLETTPSDALACDEQAAAEAEAVAAEPASANTTVPLLVIGGAAVVALLAAVVLLLRRRRRRETGGLDPQAAPGSLPVAPAVGPSPVAGPLVAGAAAPQRAARLAPAAVQHARSVAASGTAPRARAVVDAVRVAQSAGVQAQAGALALVAAAAGTLADADAGARAASGDPHVEVLEENLRTLARGAARAARRAASSPATTSSAEVERLQQATARLVQAHRRLLAGTTSSAPRGRAPIPTEAPR